VLEAGKGRCVHCASLAVENWPSATNGKPLLWAQVGRRPGAPDHGGIPPWRELTVTLRLRLGRAQPSACHRRPRYADALPEPGDEGGGDNGPVD